MVSFTKNIGRIIVETVIKVIQSTPIPQQKEFMLRSLDRSVQGRFCKQGGSSYTIALCAAMYGSTGHKVIFVSRRERCILAYAKVVDFLDEIGVEYLDSSHRHKGEKKPYKYKFVFPNQPEAIITICDQYEDGSWDFAMTDFGQIHRLSYLREEGIRVLELSSGSGGIQWDKDPIMMSWFESAIIDKEFMENLKNTIPPDRFARDFLPTFDEDD